MALTSGCVLVQVCKARRQALSFTSCGTFLEVLVISLATSALHLVLPVFGTCLPCTPHDVGPPPPDNYGSPPHFTLDALSFSSVLGLGAMPARMSGYTTICGAGLKRFRAFTPFQCAPDHYNDLTVLLFNTANEAVAALLGRFHGRPFTLLSLTAFFLFYFFMTVWTYGAAIPSGFFTPNILMGAILGCVPPAVKARHRHCLGKTLVYISTRNLPAWTLLSMPVVSACADSSTPCSLSSLVHHKLW